MKKKILVVVGLLLSGAFSSAKSDVNPAWQNKNGKIFADTEWRKIKGSFGAMLMTTSDANWQSKWEGAAQPSFNVTDKVSVGNKIFILTFLSHPKLDGQNLANVRCDLKVVRPDGSTAQDLKDVDCFNGPLGARPYDLKLGAPIIGFSADPGDKLGKWIVSVNVIDKVGGVTIPLKTSFRLIK